MDYVEMKSGGGRMSFFFADPELTLTFPIKHPDAAHAELSRSDLGLSESNINALISKGLEWEVFGV